MTASHQVIRTSPSTMPPGPWAQAAVYGDTIYVAGQVAFDPASNGPISSDIAEQTVQVIKNLRTVLGEAGAGLEHIVKLNCILAMFREHYQRFNEAFAGEFGDVYPPRTTIQAGLGEGYLVEIEAVARVP